MWVGCTQLINESVERHRLAMSTSSTIGRRCVNEWSVHVPLHKRNSMIAQQRIELTKHMCVCRIVGQIKHQLVARQYWFIIRRMQHPVGMRPQHIAI